jgi:Zn-dependent M16 (insulinase) family peptidase
LWLPFFSHAAVSVGLPGMDYGKVSGLLARTTGGFYAMLETGSMVPGASRTAVFPQGIFDIRGRDWIIFRLKALDEKMAPSLDLALRLITEGDFGDLKRIRDLALELKNDMDSSLAPSGHSVASSRSGRGFSRARGIDETWNGLEQLFFVHRLAEMEAGEISGRLRAIREKIARSGIIINLGGSGDAIKSSLGEIGQRFGAFGPPLPRRETAAFTAYRGEPEVFASDSLQVGFAALTVPASPYDSAEQAAELVLSHQLSTGPLWEAIRMKGGAYGAFTHPDNLEGAFSFSTYRDPDPLRSLETFPALLKDLANAGIAGGEEELVKAVIGAYSRETYPRTGAEKSFIDFFRFLYGVEDGHRSRRLKSLIAVREEETAAILRRLASLAEKPGSPVIIAGRAQAEKAAARLNCNVKELPV